MNEPSLTDERDELSLLVARGREVMDWQTTRIIQLDAENDRLRVDRDDACDRAVDLGRRLAQAEWREAEARAQLLAVTAERDRLEAGRLPVSEVIEEER